MNELVKFRRETGIGVITVENPPVNALSPGVPEGIRAGIEAAESDSEVHAVVMIGGGRTFIAGADIREFAKVRSGEKPRLPFHPLLRAIEDCSKPVVMAVHGTAFGGGLETAMAGHYRVAAASARVGQPEIKLGIIPGAGGTQRLPRLAGVEKAVEMCAFGEPIDARTAMDAGILDRIIEGNLLEGALTFAHEVAGQPHRKTRDRAERLNEASDTAAIFASARERARQITRGQLAPLGAIDAVEAATKLTFEEGLKREAEIFMRCLFSTQSEALMHVFFGERTVSKIPDIPKETRIYQIRDAAVVGADAIGREIAMTCANAGIPVVVKETRREALEGFEQADIVIEVASESVALKKQIFSEIDSIAKPDCILASNTSTLDIDEIASATRRPEMVVGLHFSPASGMRLVEIVRGKATRPEVIATSMALAKRLGKVGVLAGNRPGLIGDRMTHAYVREAQFLVDEGAAVETVNQAMYDFGFAAGPLAVRSDAGGERGHISPEEIVERTVYALVNEGARILEEGTALRAVDIDIVSLNRYGFPAWRGGPMFYAGMAGLKTILKKVEEFEKRWGPGRWTPAPLLKRLAEVGKTFESFDQERSDSR